MNMTSPDPDPAAFTRLLREARPEEALPPRFAEGVWRRIRRIEAEASDAPGWLVRVVNTLLQPRWAVAGLTALMVLGATLGTLRGQQTANDLARARYLATVAPNPVR